MKKLKFTLLCGLAKVGMDFKDDVFSEVKRLYGKGIIPGTQTTGTVLKRLGQPELNYKIIHVAGTNGKGSVCEYLTQILIAAGQKVGTFTSPYAYDYGEQFRIDGAPADRAFLGKCFGDALAVSEDLNATGFEIETAGALLAFARSGCGYAVVECGMGGRDDATNAISSKELAVITSIGLEHTAYLGDTIAEICAHKAGIIKGCKSVASAYQPEEATEYLKKEGVVFADKEIRILQSGLYGQTFRYGNGRFELSMPGCAQPYNAATAIEAARLLGIDETAIYEGVKRAKLPARLEVKTAGGVTYVLDGSHNPASFMPLRDFIESNFGSADAVVYGSLSDKDVDCNLFALKDVAEKIIAVTPAGARAMDKRKIYVTCLKYGIRAETAESVESALEGLTGTVVVCGTFTILGEAEKWIDKKL